MEVLINWYQDLPSTNMQAALMRSFLRLANPVTIPNAPDWYIPQSLALYAGKEKTANGDFKAGFGTSIKNPGTGIWVQGFDRLIMWVTDIDTPIGPFGSKLLAEIFCEETDYKVWCKWEW